MTRWREIVSNRSTMAFGVGIALIVAAILSVDTTGPRSSIHLEASGQADTTLYPLIASNDPSHPLEAWLVTLGIQGSAPPVNAGAGLQVTVEFSLKSVRWQWSGTDIDPTLEPGPFSEIRRRLRDELTAELSIAGATVAPSGFTPVDQQLSANWSVVGADEGRFVGLVKTKLTPPGATAENPGGLLDVEMPGDLHLDIVVRPRPWTLRSFAALAASTIGIIATLGAIVGVYWTWLDRRRKLREAVEQDRPRIYTTSGDREERR